MGNPRNRKVHSGRKLGLALTSIALLSLVLWRPAGSQTAGVQATTALTTYTVIDLGTLGGTFSFAGGLNNIGQVVGASTLPGDTEIRAFLWSEGAMTDLGTLGGPNSFTNIPLNDRGEIVGSSDTSTPDPLGEDFCGFGTHLICLPFLWKDGVMTPLPTLGGNNGAGFEINNRGQSVGGAENTTPDPTCVAPQVLQFKPVIRENGAIRELPTFPGDPDGFGTVINDKGQAAGVSGICANPFLHALLWQNGTANYLGNLGGTMNNLPTEINEQGQVVGRSDLPGDTTSHAFLWQNGVMTDLGTLPGDFSSEADGINSEGQVVGCSNDAAGNSRAFLWQNGVMTDLNTLIPAGSPLFLWCAGGTINSRGQIAGAAVVTSTGEFHAFLATRTDPGTATGNAPLTSRGEITERPKVVIPENVRQLIGWGMPGMARFKLGLIRPK